MVMEKLRACSSLGGTLEEKARAAGETAMGDEGEVEVEVGGPEENV